METWCIQFIKQRKNNASTNESFDFKYNIVQWSSRE